MNIPAYAFKRFWDVHAWAGVVTSLIVYFMFVFGAAVLFYDPLTVWCEPLMQRPALTGVSVDAPLRLARDLPQEFYYYLPKHGQGPHKLGYFLPDTTDWRMWWLDAAQGRAVPHRELAAAYVYDLHYLWHAASGYWLQYGAGVLVFGFLLAIVTGVLIHLKGLGRQLHQFRPGAAKRVVWSDMHKVTGVFGLPFLLVYALTGTLMALSPLLFQLSVGPVFGGQELQAVKTAGALIDDPPPRDYGDRSEPLALEVLVAKALAREPRLEPESFIFRGYRQYAGTVDVRGPIRGEPFGEGHVRLRARDGFIEHVQTPDNESAVGTVARWIHGLHTIEYGGLTARLFVFVLAIAGCVTVLSGNWIWLERRPPSRGNHLLARLTTGVGTGAIVALVALFAGSRLLPLNWGWRVHAEELILAIAFFGCVTTALTTSNPSAIWWRRLAASGTMLLALPALALAHSGAGLFGAGPHHPTVVGVEIGFVVLGCAVLATALLLRRAKRAVASTAGAQPHA
jgi:uncharacterized iron-regulated membrane protein